MGAVLRQMQACHLQIQAHRQCFAIAAFRLQPTGFGDDVTWYWVLYCLVHQCFAFSVPHPSTILVRTSPPLFLTLRRYCSWCSPLWFSYNLEHQKCSVSLTWTV